MELYSVSCDKPSWKKIEKRMCVVYIYIYIIFHIYEYIHLFFMYLLTESLVYNRN